MAVLISLAEAKKHLNIETYFTDDDTYISALIDAAMALIKAHCNQNWLDLDYTAAENTGYTEYQYPTPVKQCILILIGNLYANREGVSYGNPVKIPYTVDFLLQPYINYSDTIVTGITSTTNIVYNEKTYAELEALLTLSGLIVGSNYLVSDYKTKHNMYDGTTVLAEINEGSLEPLILRAISASKFDSVVKSTIYPDHEIDYDFTDNLCEDNTTSRNGKITYRKDEYGNQTTYDFMNVKFRRWKFDLSGYPEFDYVAYVEGDIVHYIGTIYYALGDFTASDTPDWDLTNWSPIIDNAGYYAYSTTSSAILGGDPSGKTYLTIPVSGGTYVDYYTFSNPLGVQKNIWFSDVKLAEPDIDIPYNNTVFQLTDQYTNYHNTIGSNSFNTIKDSFKNNSINDGFTGNVILGGFVDNVIQNNFSYNIINITFTENIIGNSFMYNTIGANFYDNNISNYFNKNITCQYFEDNILGSGFNSNIALESFQQNRLNSAVINSRFGSGFDGNQLGAAVSIITTSDFANNTVQSGVIADLSHTTELHQPYSCNVFIDFDSVVKVSYIKSDSLTVIALS